MLENQKELQYLMHTVSNAMTLILKPSMFVKSGTIDHRLESVLLNSCDKIYSL